MLKRIFDFTAAFFGAIMLSPLLGLLGILVKLSSPGPVFYRGVKVGKGLKPFRIFKFRSMVSNAEKLGGPSTPIDDERLTGFGIFLKQYQLDELPQLFNILKGEMSFVGPRPEVQIYVDMMSDEERKIIYSVLPGMTDIACLWNFHEGEILKGSPDPENPRRQLGRGQPGR